jgi:VanZ family protein
VPPGAPPLPEKDSQLVLSAWLAPLIWLGIIFLLSGGAFSSDITYTLLVRVLHWAVPQASEETLFFLNYAVRKTAHVVAYGVLSLLLFRALRGSRNQPGRPQWTLRWAVLAVVLSLATAAADELHQALVPARDGTLADVALNGAAAVGMQLGVYLWWRRRAARNEAVAMAEKATA